METSKVLSSVARVVHGFGNLASPIPLNLNPYWETRPDKMQVHKDRIAKVNHYREKVGDCDGVITKVPSIVVHAVSADCAPVLLAKRDGTSVCAIHSGWRGTLADIVARWAESIETPSEWVASIGPTIGPCCYQVSEEIITQFVGRYPEISPRIIEPSHRKLDIRSILKERLIALGVSQLDTVGGCTYCTQSGGAAIYHSFRREGGNTRQYSGIMLKPL